MSSSGAGEDVRPALDVVWRNAGKLLDSDLPVLPFPIILMGLMAPPWKIKKAAMQSTIERRSNVE